MNGKKVIWVCIPLAILPEVVRIFKEYNKKSSKNESEKNIH